MSIFQKSIVKKHISSENPEVLKAKWNLFTSYFHNVTIQENIHNSKEEQFQEGFLRELFVKVLGYTLNPEPNIVQGITSLTVSTDNVFLHLIENAPFNKGKEKLYEGVAGNLVAFACRLSFQRGSDGFVSFHSKTNLIDHYVKSLNAIHYGIN